jgi:drug/metabolite transporter (DMT)-like permease
VAVPVRQWLPGLVGLALIWGSSFLFIKVGVSGLPPTYVALGRVASGLLVLLIVLAITKARLPRDPTLWAHNVIVAVIGIAAPFTLFSYAETQISSVLAGIWNSVTPLIVLPMAVAVFRTETLSARKVLGLLLGLVGALIILGVWQGVGGASLGAQLMCVAAAACYGVAIPYVKKFIAPHPHSGAVMSAGQLLVATLLLAVAAPLASGGLPNPAALTWPVVASVFLLGAVGTGVAFVINLRNIRLVGATTASMVTYIVPVFATVLGVVVLSERLEWFQPLGAVVVLLGVAISQGVLGRTKGSTPAPSENQALPLCTGESGQGRP